MAIKSLNKTLASRHASIIDRKWLRSKNKVVKELTKSKKNIAGRNVSGKIVMHGRGGGVSRRLRYIENTLDLYGQFRVLRLEYDPTRNAFLALVSDSNGNLSYRIAPESINSGMYMDR
jgi:ribosomal protein L2